MHCTSNIERRTACRAAGQGGEEKSLKAERRRIETNRQLYERLSRDKHYKDVRFDAPTGALRATHLGHKSGLDMGFVLEQKAVNALYQSGHCIILCDESKKGRDGNVLVSLDVVLDGVRMDIKSITKNKLFYGAALREKNAQLVKFNARPDVHQLADTLCLYFDDPTMFAPGKITAGYNYMIGNTTLEIQLRHIICIVNSAKGFELKSFDFGRHDSVNTWGAAAMHRTASRLMSQRRGRNGRHHTMRHSGPQRHHRPNRPVHRPAHSRRPSSTVPS